MRDGNDWHYGFSAAFSGVPLWSVHTISSLNAASCSATPSYLPEPNAKKATKFNHPESKTLSQKYALNPEFPNPNP